MCDMCSSDEIVYKIELEGTMLNVCEKCSSFGRVIGRIKQAEPVKAKKKQGRIAQAASEGMLKPKKTTETVQLVVSNYSDIIKRGRERLGLKQEEFAKKLNEKESVIHKLESGQIKPNIDLARKLERFLKVALVEEVEIEGGEGVSDARKGATDNLTIGDMINIR
ncbi:MAG TPA: multiprotein bridging factor aMBF1 [Candidatus Nanoarchaeia archaeon]|nr:multiprotein bridging factor aMBF1 [Candidatus Nanoarchaeia archaeon]